MIFKDEVEIQIKAGKGGDGAATFRREKYVPKGGPDGGDGGDGGDVILRANSHLRTLSHIHRHQKFKAQDGVDGRGRRMTGKKGKSIYIDVPPGTIARAVDDGELLADLTENGQEHPIARGGKGGQGNWHFKSSVNQTPFYAKNGTLGDKRRVHLELKMIAHIGLVGFPNAGKSTLISRITNARPKIADFPFTTLQPNLGVMTVDDAYTSILIADIPGLIEGAHEGKGLGIEFLKHIERTRIILYMLDITDEPIQRFEVLRRELREYSVELFERDFLVALNKTDLIYDRTETEMWDGYFRELTEQVHYISAVTGEGLNELKQALYQRYKESEKQEQEANHEN